MTLIVSHREWLAADRRAVLDAARWAEQVFDAQKLYVSPCQRFAFCTTGIALTPSNVQFLFRELTELLCNFYRGKQDLAQFLPERGSEFWNAVDERRVFVTALEHRWVIDDKEVSGKSVNYIEEMLEVNEVQMNGSAVATAKAVWLSGYHQPADLFRVANAMTGECSVEFDICLRSSLLPFTFHEE